MRVALTAEEQAQARGLAADLGRDPAEMIAEGEELKGRGYAGAARAAGQTVAVMGGAGSQMAAGFGPAAAFQAEPEPEAGG